MKRLTAFLFLSLLGACSNGVNDCAHPFPDAEDAAVDVGREVSVSMDVPRTDVLEEVREDVSPETGVPPVLEITYTGPDSDAGDQIIHVGAERHGFPVATYRFSSTGRVRVTGVFLGWDLATPCVDAIGIDWGEGTEPAVYPAPINMPALNVNLSRPIRRVNSSTGPIMVRVLAWFRVPIAGSPCEEGNRLRFGFGLTGEGTYTVDAEEEGSAAPAIIHGGGLIGPYFVITR